MTTPAATEGRNALRRRQIISLVALVLVTLGAAYYVVSHANRFAVILRVPPAGVAAIGALSLLTWHARGAILRTAMRGMGAQVNRVESNLLIWATFYWNYLPMKPGMFAQAVHMKLRRGLAYSGFVAYLVAANLVGLFIRSVLGLAFTVPLAMTRGLTPLLPAVFAGVALACGVVMAIPIRWEYRGHRYAGRALERVVHAWRQFRRAPRLLAGIGAWHLAVVAGGTAQFYLCLRYVGVDNALPQALTASLLSPLTAFTAFVPGNLGVNEALVGVVVLAFGGSLTDGVVSAALGRAVRMGMILVLGPWASHRLLFQHTDAPPEEGTPQDAEAPT